MSFGAYPIGGVSIAGGDPALSGATPDPLPGLLRDPTAPREFLLRAAPPRGNRFEGTNSYKAVNVPVNLSSSGYAGSLSVTPLVHTFGAKDVRTSATTNRITLNNGSAPNIAYRGANDFDNYEVGAEIVMDDSLGGGFVRHLITDVDPSGLWVEVASALDTVNLEGIVVTFQYDSMTLFHSCLAQPYKYSTALAGPEFSGGASIGSGNIIAKNTAKRSGERGPLDDLAMYDWLGTVLDVYIGRRGAPLEDFTLFSRTRAAGVIYDLDTIAFLQRDLRFRLQRPLQPRRYRGFGACLRFNGSSTYGAVTHACPANSMTMEIMLRSSGTVASVGMSYRNGAGVAGVRTIQPNTGSGFSSSAGNVRFSVRNDANTAFEVLTGTGVLSGTQLVRISCVLDTSAMAIMIYADGVLKGTTAVTGTFATTLSNLEIGRDGGSAANWYTGDADDVRTWSVALTEDQILDTMHRELTGGETGLSYYNKLNNGAGATATATVGSDMTLTIPSDASWVGSLEGDETIYNVVLPSVFGEFYECSPVLVDPINNVWQINGRAIESISFVKDSGAPISFDADNADIYATSPGLGEYSTSLANGLIRLGYVPEGEVTVSGEGDAGGSLGYVSSAADIHRKVAVEFGGLVDPDELDVASYARLNLKNSAPTYLYYTDEINCDVVLDEAVAGITAWWSPNRLSKIVVGRIDAPQIDNVTGIFDIHTLVDPTRGGAVSREPVGVRVGRVVLGYLKYGTTLDPSSVFGAATLTERSDIGTEYRFVVASDPDASDDADTITVYTTLVTKADAQVEADRILAMRRVDRESITVAIDTGLLTYFLGDEKLLDVDRFDWDGKPMVIVGLNEDMGQFGQTEKLGVTLYG